MQRFSSQLKLDNLINHQDCTGKNNQNSTYMTSHDVPKALDPLKESVLTACSCLPIL